MEATRPVFETQTGTALPTIIGQAPVHDHHHRKLLSTLRLKLLLSLFVGLLVIGLSGLVVYLVSGIFARLTPSMEADLAWKARRGARELAQTADLALAAGDPALVTKAFGDYRNDPAVKALVAQDTQRRVLGAFGKLPAPAGAMFAGEAGAVRAVGETLVSWATAEIEGNVVGRVAVAISTARLEEGQKLRRHLLGIAAGGCVLALVLSLLFVHFYLVPLIALTQRGLRQSRELEIAKRIQTSILPSHLRIEGLELSAAMVPATEVGGDYYDVIASPGGCWIGIGDVAGHGVPAGLIMLMIQSVVSAEVRRRPDSAPSEILSLLNEVLYDNVRHRLRSDEHATLTLLHLDLGGRVTFAGAHEEILVWRTRTGRCERIETPGTWIGASRKYDHAAVNSSLDLQPGDLMVLHTDGITEARAGDGKRFGIERLCQAIEERPTASADQIRDMVLSRVSTFAVEQDDDRTIFVLRYLGGRA